MKVLVTGAAGFVGKNLVLEKYPGWKGPYPPGVERG